MKKIITIILLITCVHAKAQFSNVWPSVEYPKNDGTKIEQLCAAYNERRGVLSSSHQSQIGAEITYTPFKSTRTTLIALKNKLRTRQTAPEVYGLGNYYLYVDSSTNMPPYYNSSSYIFTNETEWCTLLNLPTNYLDYTPRRCLSGLGPFFDDATVGHGHGWTNSYTVDGGTNYPPGRTNWYTTDYGIEGVKTFLSRMIVTETENAFRDALKMVEYNTSTNNADTIYSAGYVGDTTYENAATDVEGQWNSGWVTETNDVYTDIFTPTFGSVNKNGYGYTAGFPTKYYYLWGDTLSTYWTNVYAWSPAVRYLSATTAQTNEGSTAYFYGGWHNQSAVLSNDYMNYSSDGIPYAPEIYVAATNAKPLWLGIVMATGVTNAVDTTIYGKTLTIPTDPGSGTRRQIIEADLDLMKWDFEYTN